MPKDEHLVEPDECNLMTVRYLTRCGRVMLRYYQTQAERESAEAPMAALLGAVECYWAAYRIDPQFIPDVMAMDRELYGWVR